ncbi:FAD/NAD(P)-binding domain-containing protein [Dichomitus squalens LYAD-421 SS1]|uniref:FAD/NAD(P)-binding domain-containing protein n=1 Tax=Dichomitus squalens (strain LYAD-421) TaxID=732165 RepID=R7T2F2_DICSQ|nr:FAD/NAD(P)-binding domain-containing protein [Dichomitus squalens LYAD-421 SS1]EJF61517.1 FAD/NAD(P)-binding domain-containing protein [Dichomitus squalens LYAD-421 SS1]
MTPQLGDRLKGTVVVIGAGIAGLITAYTLLRDGFEVQVLTRDAEAGGVWSQDRIYPGLFLNNVHGEYRLSPMEMSPLVERSDVRLGGQDLNKYTTAFASTFLKGKIEYGIEVHRIRRGPAGSGWQLEVLNRSTALPETRLYDRLVLCTGGCSAGFVPESLSPSAASAAGFHRIVCHSVDFGRKRAELLASVPEIGLEPSRTIPSIVVVGGGKSAQDICTYLANERRKVTIVCPDFDAFTARPKPLPDFIRKSRLLALLSPHIHLRTGLERFLHTTRLGKKIVNSWWNRLAEDSYRAAGVPADSPLRRAVRPFWHTRVNDEGVPRSNGFHALVSAGKVEVICPARVARYGRDGISVILEDGRSLPASAVVLSTGYRSSWPTIFDEETTKDLGLDPQPVNDTTTHQWKYTTLSNAPPLHPEAKRWSSTLYHGIVPAKHIVHRDLAVNGAVLSPNFGYTTEVTAHWISSYFLGDRFLRLPATSEEALALTEREAAWLRTRYPQIPTALNNSHTSYLAFWSWPQHVDDLLEDMGLPVMRSGGNALTWPLKVVDLKEISSLKEERDKKRAGKKS